jgi:hypothetical protein
MRIYYKKAILAGVFGTILICILFAITIYLVGGLFPTDNSGVQDSGPAAVGTAMIFTLASLASMILVGGFSVWWSFKESFSLKNAMEVSAIAGAVPMLGLCFIIFVFEILVSTYGPNPNFQISTFLNTLTSGLSACCLVSFIVGIMLSVIGGLIYSSIVFLLRKT